MRRLLIFSLIVCMAHEQTLLAAAVTAAAKHYTACTLLTLQDAKALIGDDAKQQDSSTDDHCYYRSDGGAAYLHVFGEVGHTWTDYKADGTPVKGVGDEAYFYPPNNPMGDTLVVRKGNAVILLNARSNGLSDEQIHGKELDFSHKMATRL